MDQDNDVVILGFFNSVEDNEAKTFLEAADMSDNVFGITTSADVAAHYKVTAPKIIALQKVYIYICLHVYNLLAII